MSSNISRGTSRNTALVHQKQPDLHAFFAKRYPEYVLFLRFVSKEKMAQYDFPHEGYGVFTSDGNIMALKRSIKAAHEWIYIEECIPIWMH